MNKKYFVQLSDSQVAELKEVIKSVGKSKQLIRRANILLAANIDGPNWTDEQVSLAYHCSPRTGGPRSFLGGKRPQSLLFDWVSPRRATLTGP